MTTLRNLVGTLTEQAQAAQAAALEAREAARTEVAPIRSEVAQQGEAIAAAGTDLEQLVHTTAALADAVDTLIIDALLGAGNA